MPNGWEGNTFEKLQFQEVHADDEKIKSQNFDVFIFSKCTGDYVELKTPQYFLEKLAAHVALAEFMKPWTVL